MSYPMESFYFSLSNIYHFSLLKTAVQDNRVLKQMTNFSVYMNCNMQEHSHSQQAAHPLISSLNAGYKPQIWFRSFNLTASHFPFHPSWNVFTLLPKCGCQLRESCSNYSKVVSVRTFLGLWQILDYNELPDDDDDDNLKKKKKP